MTTDQPNVQSKDEQPIEQRTYLMPFIISTLLSLPTLAVLAATKASAGFTLFVLLGYFDAIKGILWVCVIVSTLSACAYFVLGSGVIRRVAVAIGLVAMLASFYVVMRS